MIIAIYFGNLEKVRLNTMPKAILELEMPESCWQYELYSTAHNCCNVIVIVGHYAICPSKGRRPDCPLKLVEDKEKHGKWVLHGNDDDLGMTYYCSVCGFGLDEDLFYSGYKDGKWIRNHVFKHCPNCGTKMDE